MGDRPPPEGYAEIDRWTMEQASAKELLVSAIVGIVAFFASLFAAVYIVGTATGTGELTIGTGSFFYGFLLGAVLGVILHEAFHGVFFLAFGGRPRFGFKPWTKLWPFFYATAPGSYFDRSRYLAAGLAPAVLLTAALAAALAIAAADELLTATVMWAFALNISGSVGDMLMMRKVMSYSSSTRFEDTGDGFVAYGPVGGLKSP